MRSGSRQNRWAFVFSALLLVCSFVRLEAFAAESRPGQLPAFVVRETAMSRDGLRLGMKHFVLPFAQPVLLVHGMAQNDRAWDPAIEKYSFARFLYYQGFDVWVGNMRGTGTEGYRSETPQGPQHWTVDDYAISDIPALIETVERKTGRKPFVIVHSLAAWAMEGYLAGLGRGSDGRVQPSAQQALSQQNRLRGVISISGVYNIKWEHPLAEAASRPIRGVDDYYHSNYELELLSGLRPLYRIIPHLPSLPLGWVGKALHMKFDSLPWIGSKLEKLYSGLQTDLIQTPVFNMLYYAPDADPDLVRLHTRDGIEDLGPHLLEQLANAIQDGKTSSYYHIDRGSHPYDYGSVRGKVQIPLLFVGGGKDRMASAIQVYEDGFLKSGARDKQYIQAENFGHMDILNGIHAPEEVMTPVVRWIRQRM